MTNLFFSPLRELVTSKVNVNTRITAVERSVATGEEGGLMEKFNIAQTLTLDSGVIFHTINK